MMRHIGWPLALLLLWDLAVTAFYLFLPQDYRLMPSLPMTLLGSALALFIGLRNNAAYGRWWEARTLWGAMVNASRSLARMSLNLIDHRPERDPRDHAARPGFLPNARDQKSGRQNATPPGERRRDRRSAP